MELTKKQRERAEAKRIKAEKARIAAISPGHPDWSDKPWKRTQPTNPHVYDARSGTKYPGAALVELRAERGVGSIKRLRVA